MNAIINVRYVSGRTEKFEMELWGGAADKARLEALLKTPNFVLQTGTELIIIVGSAVECISITLPESGDGRFDLDWIRPAKRLD
jgi:hypothetical protein